MDTVTSILASGSTLLAIAVGMWGFFRWRADLFAKRRIELCEDVLTRVYECRDAIEGIRSPLVFGGEGSTRPRVEGELDEVRKRAEAAYVYFERYETRKEPLIALNSLRYRFMAVYGPEWSDSFQVFVGVVKRVATTAGILRMEREDRAYYGRDAEQRLERAVERRERHEAILWKGFASPDPIDLEISVAVQRLEDKCRGEIAKSASVWYGFRRDFG